MKNKKGGNWEDQERNSETRDLIRTTTKDEEKRSTGRKIQRLMRGTGRRIWSQGKNDSERNVHSGNQHCAPLKYCQKRMIEEKASEMRTLIPFVCE